MLAGTQRVARRVLVIPRTERSKEEARLIAHLSETGSEVKFDPRPGYTGMMRDDPYETEVPFAALDAVVDWLDDGSRSPSRPPAPAGSPAHGYAVTRGDKKVVETPLTFGEDGVSSAS